MAALPARSYSIFFYFSSSSLDLCKDCFCNLAISIFWVSSFIASYAAWISESDFAISLSCSALRIAAYEA